MTSAVATTGITGNTYKALFRRQILRVKPPVVGMAVAYVSMSGFNREEDLMRAELVRSGLSPTPKTA